MPQDDGDEIDACIKIKMLMNFTCMRADVDISKFESSGPSQMHAGCVRLLLGDGFKVCHGPVRSIGLSQATEKAKGHR